MLSNETMQDAMDYLAGRCNHTASLALTTTYGMTYSEEELNQFEQFLEDNDCFECEVCGWWTHPGEDCAPICSDCEEAQANDEEEYAES